MRPDPLCKVHSYTSTHTGRITDFAPGSVVWFEIGAADPRSVRDFYGRAFGWRFVVDDTAGGKQYSNIFTGHQWPSGGMYDLGGDGVNYLMPGFLATDVPATTAKAAGQFGFASSTDMDQAFNDASFDLIDICLPTKLHAQYVLRALDAGKHALVELPLADNQADAQRVVEATERGDKQVFVDMFERFIPANRALFDAVGDGTYGRLEQLTLWNLTAHLWPGASLGLKVLPLEAMHSDMDIITRTLGLPHNVEVATVARDADSASIEAIMSFAGAFARDSVSSLMPMSWGPAAAIPPPSSTARWTRSRRWGSTASPPAP